MGLKQFSILIRSSYAHTRGRAHIHVIMFDIMYLCKINIFVRTINFFSTQAHLRRTIGAVCVLTQCAMNVGDLEGRISFVCTSLIL